MPGLKTELTIEPQAGDTVYSLGAISIDIDGTCRVRLDVSLLAKDDVRHRLRPELLVVILTDEQKAMLADLRTSITAQVAAAPPARIAEAVPVEAQTREVQRQTRLATR